MNCDFDNAAMTCPRCGYIAGGRDWRKNCRGAPGAAAPVAGAGAELHKLLAGLGFEIRPSCPCLAHIREMNRRGPGWCDANLPTILGWLRDEAAARGLPFPARLARFIIRRAIRAARIPSQREASARAPYQAAEVGARAAAGRKSA